MKFMPPNQNAISAGRSVGAAMTDRGPTIDDELVSFGANVERLFALFKALEDRFGCFVRPAEPQPERAGKPASAQSGFAEALRTNNYKLHELCNSLENFVARCDRN